MIIKKILLVLLIILPIYIGRTIYLLDKTYFLCPVQYKDRGDFVIRCDSRGDGFFASSRGGGLRQHKGIDLLAPVGTPVFASRSGTVIEATTNHGMGKYVKIQHAGGLVTLYGHLSEIYVSTGDFLRQSDVLGSVGKTGNANSPGILPHLHFETRENGMHTDPHIYLQ